MFVMKGLLFTDQYFLYWPALPHDPQGIRVASDFEFSVCLSVCLFVCLSVLGKFSNFFVQYKAAGVLKNVVRMNTDILI